MWGWPVLAGIFGLGIVLLLIRLLSQNRQIEQLSIALRRPELSSKLLDNTAQGKSVDFEALVNTLEDPVILISARHRILYQNPVAENLWPLLSDGTTSLIEATRAYELDDFADNVLRGHHELPHEMTITSHLYRVVGTRITRPDGSIGAIVILRDISELQRLGRARRDFVANISHELRTPLTAIRLLADTLKVRVVPNDPNALKLLDQITSQTDTLTQLTQELYDLTQIESGHVPMRMISVNLRELVNGVIARLSPQAERAGLTLRNDIPETVQALVDAAQIARVLSNLIHNAIKFTPKGEIAIFSLPIEPHTTPMTPYPQDPDEQPAEYITMGVRDTGTGIPKEELPRIFERFYKVDRARGQGGTGLGLAIAKHIIEAHGCRIWAESTLSRGTTFYFTVPRDA